VNQRTAIERSLDVRYDSSVIVRGRLLHNPALKAGPPLGHERTTFFRSLSLSLTHTHTHTRAHTHTTHSLSLSLSLSDSFALSLLHSLVIQERRKNDPTRIPPGGSCCASATLIAEYDGAGGTCYPMLKLLPRVSLEGHRRCRRSHADRS